MPYTEENRKVLQKYPGYCFVKFRNKYDVRLVGWLVNNNKQSNTKTSHQYK